MHKPQYLNDMVRTILPVQTSCYLEIMSNGLKRRTQTGIMVEVKGRSNSDSWLVDSNKTYPILKTFDWLKSMTHSLISHSITHEPLTDPNKFEMKK